VHPSGRSPGLSPGALLANLTTANVNACLSEKKRSGRAYAARNDASVLKAFANWLDQTGTAAHGAAFASSFAPKHRLPESPGNLTVTARHSA